MANTSRFPAARILAGAALVLGLVAVVWAVAFRSPPEAPTEIPTIGLITNNPNGLRNVAGFREGMAAQGYTEGDGALYLYSGTPTPTAELEGAIRQMVADGADIIFTAGTPTGVAAKAATQGSGVPVVFGVIADPVAAGVMTDLTRPGGNMTGVMLSQNQARRLELLRNVLPQVRRVLVPYNPDDPAPVSAVAQLDDVAPEMNLTLVHAEARDDDAVSRLIADLPQDIDAVFMLPDSTVNRRIADLIAATNARGLPVSGPSTAQVEAGALMAYGIVHREVGGQAARIASRILRGADPADMPVETANFYLTVNTAAADRIGLDLPEEILQQADVILRNDSIGEQ
ncbi:MAG: ABC transporter substrate-binding protein [Rhodobacter sp.]|nr:ABC transporter substrate-binding protein [Rhodobacter sp.]